MSLEPHSAARPAAGWPWDHTPLPEWPAPPWPWAVDALPGQAPLRTRVWPTRPRPLPRAAAAARLASSAVSPVLRQPLAEPASTSSRHDQRQHDDSHLQAGERVPARYGVGLEDRLVRGDGAGQRVVKACEQ